MFKRIGVRRWFEYQDMPLRMFMIHITTEAEIAERLSGSFPSGIAFPGRVTLT